MDSRRDDKFDDWTLANSLAALARREGQHIWALVEEGITKDRFGNAYIGVKLGLIKGEIIQVGNPSMQYKVMKLSKILPTGARRYKIKRRDGYLVTSTEINAVEVGSKLRVITRRAFRQIMEQHGLFDKKK